MRSHWACQLLTITYYISIPSEMLPILHIGFHPSNHMSIDKVTSAGEFRGNSRAADSQRDCARSGPKNVDALQALLQFRLSMVVIFKLPRVNLAGLMLSQPLTKYLQTRPLPTHINPGFSPYPPPLRPRLAIYAGKKAIRPMHVKFRSTGIYYQRRSHFSFDQSRRKYILKPRSERLYSHFRKRGGGGSPPFGGLRSCM